MIRLIKILLTLVFVVEIRGNVAQLGLLIDYYTPYTWSQLLHHGNWCGLGGNRARDGSIRDSCDACCKSHDACYFQLIYKTRESYVDTISGISNLISGSGGRNKRLSEADLTSRRCIPYTDVYHLNTNGRSGSSLPTCNGSVCSKEVCRCDIQFTNCLRYTRCDLGKGNSNSNYNRNRRY